MPHSLNSCGSDSPPASPSAVQNNTSQSSHPWEPEYDPHSVRSVYPRSSEDQQPSQPSTGHYSTANSTSTETNNSLYYHPESTQSPMTQAQAYVYQPPPPPSSQFYHRPQSDASTPWTPAPTTSVVHNRDSRSNSISSTISSSSLASQHQPSAFQYTHMLARYLTVNPAESSLVHEERRAILEGLVQEGEDTFARRSEEQGWIISNHNSDYDGQAGQEESDGSRTLGRSRDGMAQ